MPVFNVHYSDDFDQKLYVEEVIRKWNQGDQEFHIYTSGTTNKPKKITLSRELLVWSARTTQNKLDTTSHKIMCCLPVDKTGGFMQLIRALVWDCEIHFFKPSNQPFIKINNHSFTTISLTPTQFKSSFEDSFKKLNKFQHILIGGAAFNNPSIFIERLKHPLIWYTYGMTETASHVAMQNLSRNEASLKVLPGVNIRQNKTLEIHIPEVNLHFKTNDIVKFENGGFVVLGRSDDVINSGGIKIHPQQLETTIEEVFEKMNLKKRFYISKEKHDKYGEVPVLTIEGNPDFNQGGFTQILTQQLPDYHAPKKIYFTPKILSTDTGKVIREAY
ncbi:MAG: AMP-binding protein [Bacteroidia bacterium]|nr:AMP-binding protein [Bacteroidia bacterium]